MELNNKNNQDPIDPYFEEVKSKSSISFDVVLWFYRILKYWYVFAISLAVCYGIAKYQNQSWLPAFRIQSLLMLENKNSMSVVAGAIPTANILRGTDNQKIVLQSHDLAERAVDKLPLKMHVNYVRKTRFKEYPLYAVTPVEVQIIDLKDNAYNQRYNIEYIDEAKCRIYYDGNETTPPFSMIVPYNQEVSENRFRIKLIKTKNYKSNFETFTFFFLNKDQLLNSFYGRVQSALKDDASSVMTISMTGIDPSRDADYLTVLLNEFQNYNLVLKNRQADQTLEFIDAQLAIITDSMNASRTTLDNFQRETGLYSAAGITEIPVEIKLADEEKASLAVKERTLLLVTKKINASILGNTPLVNPSTFGVDNPRLVAAVNEYNSVLENSLLLGAKNPLYNQTVDELNKYRKNIVEELQLQLTLLQEDKDKLRKKYSLLELKVDNLPPQERELVKFQRENKINEMYQQFLSQRKYEAQIQKASNTSDNYVLEQPRLIGGAVNTGETSKRTSYFLMIGLIIPIAFVILKEEVLKNKLSTKEDCERISGLPVIGAIENVTKKLKNGVVLVKNYPKSSFAESFRNIRVRLEYMAQRETNISVLVTSAEPADGKTFIATNVASVYQLTGKKVIIIDLDLRRPSVSKTLQLEAHRGISNYIIGQVTLDEIIIKDSDYGFDIISAGTLPPNPSELIKTTKARELIEQLKTMYDYVIIDCSPVGLVSDAYILSRYVDTTLFVVRRNKTSKAFFKSVTTQLRYDNVSNLSIVFNDVKGREGYYGTARYYGDKTYYLKKSNYYHDDYFDS